MENKVYELLSILKYPVSEKMFKEKIGTGEELGELVEKGVLENDGYGHYLVNFESDKIINGDSPTSNKELHQNIIDTYYMKNVDGEVNSDYSRFVGSYMDYINLAYHYRELGNFDGAIEKVFYIAKKLTFWGLGDQLIAELDKYKDNELNNANYLWKQYYISFSNLIHPAGEINEDEFFQLVKYIEEQGLNNAYTLYLETKNLEGIYFKQVKNDDVKAIAIFEEEAKRYEKYNGNSCRELEIAYARMVENLGLSISKDDLKKSDEYFSKAENIFERYEEDYELAKLHLFKLSVLCIESDEDMVTKMQGHDKLNHVLKNHTFPDIERNLFNLLSEEFFIKENSICGYIEIKIQALLRDFVLYFENFETDFIDILNRIEDALKAKHNDINQGIVLLMDFLSDLEMNDEMHFIEGIKAHILGENIEEKLSKISNTNLKALAYRYVEGLTSN